LCKPVNSVRVSKGYMSERESKENVPYGKLACLQTAESSDKTVTVSLLLVLCKCLYLLTLATFP